jgi:hypothetical protein
VAVRDAGLFVSEVPDGGTSMVASRCSCVGTSPAATTKHQHGLRNLGPNRTGGPVPRRHPGNRRRAPVGVRPAMAAAFISHHYET